MEAQDRYQPNDEYGGRKERNGFVCSSATRHKYWFCVAVKINDDSVQIRDTKDVTDTTLSFTHNEWRAFLKGISNGEFDV
ncbi:MAG: DUF397 domain-containing protein [Patescibacteria group bacterium]|nr:DUF397 domain-containing protein [Patescibacteria group bacterium]